MRKKQAEIHNRIKYVDFIVVPILIKMKIMQQYFWKIYRKKECFRQLVINHFKDTGRITDKIASN